MSKKKVTGFVLGLVGSIVCGVLGFYVVFVIGLAYAIAAQQGNLMNILLWLELAGAALGIIASMFYFKKPKVGGILMLVAFLLDVSIYVYIMILSKSFSIQLALLMLPSLAVLASAILGLVYKKPTQLSPAVTKTEKAEEK